MSAKILNFPCKMTKSLEAIIGIRAEAEEFLSQNQEPPQELLKRMEKHIVYIEENQNQLNKVNPTLLQKVRYISNWGLDN